MHTFDGPAFEGSPCELEAAVERKRRKGGKEKRFIYAQMRNPVTNHVEPPT
jgi:hypothetical protein